LELLFLAVFVGDGGERTLGFLNGSGGRGPLLLERVELVNGLSLNGRAAVIMADPVLLLVGLDLRQSVPCRSGPEAELSVGVSVLCHLSSAPKTKTKKQKKFSSIYIYAKIL
jgi:hypothetical protein